MRTCSVEGCDARHYGRGYCRPHWTRWYKYGDPHGGRPIGRTPQLPSLLNQLGITYRQFDWWCRKGYVAGLSGKGSGYFREVQGISEKQQNRLEALITASRLQAMPLPDLADAIQDGSVKCVEGCERKE